MFSPDDTQPSLPVRVPVEAEQYDLLEAEPPTRGPGCLTYGLLGVGILVFAVLIIALSAFAGWTSGQRVAQANGTATQSAAINEQLNRIAADVSNGNTVLLEARLKYLATLTPGVAEVETIGLTATALYERKLPTATPLPSPTVNAAPTATETLAAALSEGTAQFDFPALLQDAETDISLRDYPRAIETLDLIMAADSTYETNRVRTLMLQSLTEQARLLFVGPDAANLAEALQLYDRIQSFSDVGDVTQLNYEAYIASLYVDAINATGIDYNVTVQRLLEIYNQVPNYRDVTSRLVSAYIGYGDAWVAQAQPCAAVGQYQNALNIVNDPSVSGKMNAAQTACVQSGTLTAIAPPPGTPGTVIAPVGVAPVGATLPPGG
jgi:hypothetical protein